MHQIYTSFYARDGTIDCGDGLIHEFYRPLYPKHGTVHLIHRTIHVQGGTMYHTDRMICHADRRVDHSGRSGARFAVPNRPLEC